MGRCGPRLPGAKFREADAWLSERQQPFRADRGPRLLQHALDEANSRLAWLRHDTGDHAGKDLGQQPVAPPATWSLAAGNPLGHARPAGGLPGLWSPGSQAAFTRASR
jgi:hypothetical protein